jgi:hypothetical protein
MIRASVPALCPGGTVLCVASGPSLTAADVNFCRPRVDAAVVVNTSFRVCPWATILYAADAQWWDDYPDAKRFGGLKFSIDTSKQPKWIAKNPDVQILRNTGERGLDRHPTGLRTGLNSGYQAINVAVHLLGAQPGRILLLGYDMQLGPKGESHHHGKHPHHRNSSYVKWLPHFQSMVAPLKELGIEIVNCTRRTKLTAFPQRALEDVIVCHGASSAA